MSAPTSDILPPPSRLDAAARALEERRDWRNLIRFVERWQAYDEPSVEARMRQARAFMALYLTDRSTMRLERLAEHEAYEREALLGLARCHRLRGWNKKAEAALHRAMGKFPLDDEVRAELELLSSAVAQEPPENLDSDVPDELVAAAELQIASGAFIKAQALLEKARRIRPNDPHAVSLLWGIHGDFSCADPLSELVERWGPEVSFADLGEEPERTEHTEHTESFSPSSLFRNVDAPEPSDSKAFPSLFKGIEVSASPFTGYNEEVTLTASRERMRELHEALDASPEAPTALSDAGAEDTQIALIVRRSENEGEVDLENSDPAPPVSQRAGRPSGDFDPGLEEEDDDIILMTGRERTEHTRSGHTPALPLDLDESMGDVSGKVAAILEQVHRDKIREAAAPKRAKRARRVVPSPDAGFRAWWLFSIGAVLFVAAAGVFALALLQLAMTSWRRSVEATDTTAAPIEAPASPDPVDAPTPIGDAGSAQ